MLPNIISKSKGNQTMKFSEVMEHNVNNIFSSKIKQKIREAVQFQI